MQLYLNSGHDIETPAQMCEAMLPSSEIPSFSVALCESVSIPAMPAYKLDGVSTFHNVEFEKRECVYGKRMTWDLDDSELRNALQRLCRLLS